MITDGTNEDKKIVQPIVATVDSMAVAQLVHQLNKRDEPKKSRFQEKINSLVSSQSIDKENLSEITSLIQSGIDDAKEEWAATAGQNTSQTTLSKYQEAISDALSQYTEGDEDLENAQSFLEANVMKKLAADPAVAKKFASNQLDKQAIKKMAKAEAEDFSKRILKRDKQAKGPAIAAPTSGASAGRPIENSGSAVSMSEIAQQVEGIPTGPRREAYFKANALFKRAKMSVADAHNKAYDMAMKQFKKAGSQA